MRRRGRRRPGERGGWGLADRTGPMASIVEELRAAEIRRLEAKLQQLRAPTDPTQLGCPAGATMLHVPSVDAADVEGAMEVLERVGAVCLRGAIDGAEARRLGAKMLSYEGRDGQGVTIEAGQVNHGFQRFSGLLDLSPRDFSPLITHPSVLAVAERLLGGRTSPQPNAAAWPAEDHIRLSSIHGAVARPQNGQGWWHVDGPMGQLSPERPLPEHSCSVVAMWALTGFSEQSGGTRIMPGPAPSHLTLYPRANDHVPETDGRSPLVWGREPPAARRAAAHRRRSARASLLRR